MSLARNKNFFPSPITVAFYWQAAISVIAAVLDPPEVTLTMPVPTLELVELNCRLSRSGLIGSLISINALVVVCTFYAFKTRNLPDNFNESRFITICAYATLVIWLAFITSYFTTAQGKYRNVLLCVALLLNGGIVLASLFLPRIYALMYVEEGKMHIHKTPTPTGIGVLRAGERYS